MKTPLFLTVRISFVETLESWLAGIGLACVSLGIASTMLFLYQYQNKMYPGIYIDGIDVGGLTKEQAQDKLKPQNDAILANWQNTPITLQVDDITISSTSAQLELRATHQESINEALTFGRNQNFFQNIVTIFNASFQPKTFTSQLAFNPEKSQQLLEIFSNKVDTPHQQPKAVLRSPGLASTLTIMPGTLGREVDKNQTSTLLATNIATKTTPQAITITAPVATVGAVLKPDEVTAAQSRAALFVGKKARFKAEDKTINLNDQALIGLLTFPTQTTATLTPLVENWASQINRPAQEPVLDYDPKTLKVKNFVPPRNGLLLNTASALEQLQTALQTIEQNASDTATTKSELEYTLKLDNTPPQKSLESTNDLGIKERIGYGDSEYAHSIPSRIHNVALTSSRINNHIVLPGEEFSFNKTLGDVSGFTGFKQAYVIRNGKTELGDGGGVCQVSTTLFRSVLNAGLEVTRRKQHSYRVSYYELNQKPGIDATVYSGEVDFRFKNDTKHAILIHTNTDSEKLFMSAELYGTSDGRSAEIVDHQVWDPRPAPAPVYTIDPSLPHGVTRQVDWAVSGIKTKFTNVIKDKNGQEVRRDEYYSNYVPWSAKYIRGA